LLKWFAELLLDEIQRIREKPILSIAGSKKVEKSFRIFSFIIALSAHSVYTISTDFFLLVPRVRSV